MKPAKLKICVNCGRPGADYHESKMSYARMIKRGLTKEQAKRRSPSCGKCVTRSLAMIAEVGEVGDPHLSL
jgi:hypothetical protein